MIDEKNKVTNSAAANFVKTAKSQIGVKETGVNNVKYNTWYYNHTVSGSDYPWCAVFVAWCGYATFGNNKIIPKSAGYLSIQDSIIKNGGSWVLDKGFSKNTSSLAKGQPGDVVAFTWGHAGIIESVSTNSFTSIEGNHSNKVARVTHKISDVYRVARPKWPSSYSTTKVDASKKFLSIAQKEADDKVKGNNYHVKYNKWYYGYNKKAKWCSEFVAWCGYKAFGEGNKIVPKVGSAAKLQKKVVENGGTWILKHGYAKTIASAAKCKPGDIITMDTRHIGKCHHIGIVEKVSGNTVHTIEGNYGDKVGRGKRSITSGVIWAVARPKWPDGTYVIDSTFNYDGTEAGAEGYLNAVFASPEQLYSSANYSYVESTQEESAAHKATTAMQQSVMDYLYSIRGFEVQDASVPDVVLANSASLSNIKKPQTKFEGVISGSDLPATTNYVEAPYARITLGGVTIGTYKNKLSYPNYINGISVKKTNGSLNEYTINLVHQIAAGDNPNYIDNLISANGYNKIVIEYGDAEAGIAFKDVNALLIDAKSSFDFFNNCINYTLIATSSSIMSTVDRRNYSAVTAKPSTIINKMLYETGELLQYFPGMQNQTFVNSNNLIPTDDQEIEIDAIENTTPLNYMNHLVSSMKSTTSNPNNTAVYALSINDENSIGTYFKIERIKTNMNTSMFPLVYEVDINYPNENSLVYNFTVNTDYTWPLAYEYAGSFPDYTYNIDNSGDIVKQLSRYNIKSTNNTSNSNISDQNWWTNVTEFPISATLETKGLTSYLLLLNYIKVNVFYFGNKRNSSGIYIVLGQEDTLSGEGFRTKLDLLRVAGDNQFITVDGRVAS